MDSFLNKLMENKKINKHVDPKNTNVPSVQAIWNSMDTKLSSFDVEIQFVNLSH